MDLDWMYFVVYGDHEHVVACIEYYGLDVECSSLMNVFGP